MKKRITSILNNKFTDNFIIALILINIIVFNFGLEDTLSGTLVQVFDIFSMIVFTLEYGLRVSVINRLLDLLKPRLVFDLLALLPYYLVFLPFKTTFLKLISAYSDLLPATFGALDAAIVIISIGIQDILMDLAIPCFVKIAAKAKKNR